MSKLNSRTGSRAACEKGISLTEFSVVLLILALVISAGSKQLREAAENRFSAVERAASNMLPCDLNLSGE